MISINTPGRQALAQARAPPAQQVRHLPAGGRAILVLQRMPSLPLPLYSTRAPPTYTFLLACAPATCYTRPTPIFYLVTIPAGAITIKPLTAFRKTSYATFVRAT